MLDQIAIWATRHQVSFEAFQAMVGVWSSDADYWSSQSLARLFSEATGEPQRKISAAPYRV